VPVAYQWLAGPDSPADIVQQLTNLGKYTNFYLGNFFVTGRKSFRDTFQKTEYRLFLKDAANLLRYFDACTFIVSVYAAEYKRDSSRIYSNIYSSTEQNI
jgi:hypothetical protein